MNNAGSPEHVVLDANAVGVDPPLGKIEHRLLLDAHRAGEIVLVVPELSLREAVNRWTQLLNKHHGRLTADRRELLKLHPSFTARVPHLDRDAAARELLDARLDALRNADVVVPGTPDASHEELIGWALARRQPFDDKGSGYRDGLLWNVVRGLAADGHRVALVSQDHAAFAEARAKGEPLATVLADEVAGAARLFETARDVIEELRLAHPEVLGAVHAILARSHAELPARLRDDFVEDMFHSVSPDVVRDLVNPFFVNWAMLGVAYEALQITVEEARRTDDGKLEASALLAVRQFVTVAVPAGVVREVAAGRPYSSLEVDEDVAGIEFDATVTHRFRLVFDPIGDTLIDAEAVEAISAEA